MNTPNHYKPHNALAFAFIFLMLVLLNLSIKAEAADIEVSVNSPSASGSLVFMLFDSPATFGELSSPVKIKKVAHESSNKYTIENIPAGEYALLIYHDINDNGILDKNFIGIPREPLGFSNNYSPKGPPSFSGASFPLNQDDSIEFNVTLKKPLGDKGRIGTGIGVIMQSSPYIKDNKIVYRMIPAITYIGERFQILGPNLQVGLLGSGDLRLALTARYRIRAYEDGDSPILSGMGDRKDTGLMGVAVEYEPPIGAGLSISAGYEHDVLGIIGGGEATLKIAKTFHLGRSKVTPSLGVRWISHELLNHDYGVSENKTNADRSAYSLSEVLNYEVGLSTFIELTESWSIILNAEAEFLSDKILCSPLVSESTLFKGFIAINYVL